jgi:hypothetical protein
MYAQGGNCFFCRKPLPKADASVEHLVAVVNGGKDNDENCVACCKALNTLFGRMSLKEKLQIVLNQRGEFRCPAQATTSPAAKDAAPKEKSKAPKTPAERFDLVLADLHKRGNARPGTVDKLLNTIRSQLLQAGDAGDEAEAVLKELSERSFVTVADNGVHYALPPKRL